MGAPSVIEIIADCADGQVTRTAIREGNMLSLDIPAGTLAGIVAFYAIVNIPEELLTFAFQEMARVLKPGGVLLIAFHIGCDVVHSEELWGVPITMDFFLFETVQIRQHLEMAGLTVDEVIERDPYPEVEYQSRRFAAARRTYLRSRYNRVEDSSSPPQKIRPKFNA